MRRQSKNLWRILAVVLVICAALAVPVLADEGGEEVSGMFGTFWALVPPIVAIVLALITKEAYSSL